MNKHEHKWVVDMLEDNYPTVCETCGYEKVNK
jgi:hypothetical protein